MRTFIENYLHFMKNCIRPHYEKLKPLKSGFIENSNFENNRDPWSEWTRWDLISSWTRQNVFWQWLSKFSHSFVKVVLISYKKPIPAEIMASKFKNLSQTLWGKKVVFDHGKKLISWLTRLDGHDFLLIGRPIKTRKIWWYVWHAFNFFGVQY